MVFLTYTCIVILFVVCEFCIVYTLFTIVTLDVAATTTTATSVTTGVLSKMDPQQVAKLLKARGASDVFITRFVENGVTGKTIVKGLSDEDLTEMGFATNIQRRGIKDILELIVSSGWF